MVVQGDQQMARTTKQTKTPATPGFAIEIKDDTDLGLAILVAVIAPGTKVLGPVGTSLCCVGWFTISTSESCNTTTSPDLARKPHASPPHYGAQNSRRGMVANTGSKPDGFERYHER